MQQQQQQQQLLAPPTTLAKSQVLPPKLFFPRLPIQLPSPLLRIPSSKESAPTVLDEKLLLSTHSDGEDDAEADEEGEEVESEKDEKRSSDGLLVVRRPIMEISTEETSSDEEEEESAEERFSKSPLEVGLSEFAKKMPIFEPEDRVDGNTDKPLPINLELALYRAKLLARNFRFDEADKILRKELNPQLLF